MKGAINKPIANEARATGGALSAEESIRQEYENSPEYRLGCEMLDALTQELGLDAETAAAMLSSGTRPTSLEMIGKKAAAALEKMQQEGELERTPEEYLDDENFIALLREVPAKIAVRLADAQRSEKNANERVASERSTGRREILEQLQARKNLPRQTRTGMTAAAEPDFANMSSDEFASFKRRIFGRG